MNTDLITEVNQQIAMGEYMAAIRLLEGQNNNNPHLLSMNAQALFYMGRYEDAYYIYHKLFNSPDVERTLVEGDFDSFDEVGKRWHRSNH